LAQSSIQLGSVGIWTTQFENFPATQMQEAAAELEELGFGAIWFGEAVGREALTQAGVLLAATKKIAVATGIANIYARDPSQWRPDRKPSPRPMLVDSSSGLASAMSR
jgi:alkanesulfonate monooxygenase SsuD/methylene tetrahydromethanopterin reductase-like flavin-dependent oxidoreductase (luciferase family)